MARIRQPAVRMFAREYNSSQHEDKGMEENAPNYVITPLGTSVNRLYFIGVMMTKTNTGTDDSPMYRAEIRDPTDTFYLYAGQYQPQALNALAELEPPALVGVVGKVRTFIKEDGTFYASVKPEMIFPVDIPQRDRWIVSAADFTLEKVRALKDAMEEENPEVEALVEKGHPKRAAESAVASVGLYGNVELEPYKIGVIDALDAVIEGGGKPLEPEPSETKPPSKEKKEKEDAGEDHKEKVLKIIGDVSDEKGALYRDIIKKCEEEGINKIKLEETIQELLDEGQIYEPTIGIIKPI